MDKGHRETDKLIDDLEKRIQNVYSRAAKETQEKLDTYMESFKVKDKKKREEVAAGTLSKSDYAKWRTGQIMVGKRWEEMLDTLSTDLANADKLAQSITQGYMYDAYALNHNYATFLVEQDSLVDTSYTLYDRHTVERLIKDEPNLLPAPTPGSKRDRELREGRIERWNAQKITSEVTQGILQGESVDKIASRMRNVAAMGSRAARRNARTAVTGAENAGRQAGFERAQDMGIDTEKQWLAVMDGRTRHEHRLLDGVHVPVDENFEVDGYEIEYPGDPSAEPEMVYNCRCTMICRIKGFEKDFTDRHNDALGDMTYEEWKAEHEKKIKKPAQKEDFELPENVRENIDKFEKKYATAKTEHYLAMDENGDIIFESGKGGKRSVDVPQQVNQSNKNGYSIHNHPAKGVFSAQDIINYEKYGQHGFVVDVENNEYILYNINPVSKYKEVDSVTTDEEYNKLMPFSSAVLKAFDDIDDQTAKERREYFSELKETISDSSERAKLAEAWLKENQEDDKKIKWLEENALQYGFIFKRRKIR